MEFADAPRLTILAVLEEEWEAAAPAIEWVTERHLCVLFPESRRPIEARFTHVSGEKGTCRVRPDDRADLAALHAGESCPFFDAYYGDSVALVLDDRITWTRARFEPYDAILSPAPPGGTWSVALRGEAPPGAVVEPGGWEHEHCDICMEKIGTGGQPEGYVTADDVWICLRCHEAHVVPRSIGFVVPPKPRP